MSLPPESFPPYGFMHAGLMDAIAQSPFPSGYEPPAGKTPEEGWKAVYQPMVDGLAQVLWPRWRRSAKHLPEWDGAAKAGMHALTVADFELMARVKPLLDTPVLQHAAGGPALPSTQAHRDFFLVEDDARAPLPVLEYLTLAERASLAQAAKQAGLDSLHERTVHWMGAHCTASVLPAKDEIQRPRPYQVSSILGQAFSYQFAEGAVTSALPSGHCLQGLQGVCAAYLELDATHPVPPKTLARLRQYAVDHGDRRVFAGVHYPSDNLASWCMALYLCDALYGARAALGRRFLAEAVMEHSQVYRAIVASRAAAYQPALAWFDELAAGGVAQAESAPAAPRSPRPAAEARLTSKGVKPKKDKGAGKKASRANGGADLPG